jgi:hypothetical protein
MPTETHAWNLRDRRYEREGTEVATNGLFECKWITIQHSHSV